jgi:Uma2 family endonuclease
MTIEEFLAFTDTRPQEEHWELIEGVPVLSPSPTDYHQIVVTNVATFLMRAKVERNASWFPMIGTGTRVPASANSLPEPDVMVKEHPPTGTPASDDALGLFEVLSPSQGRPTRTGAAKSTPACRMPARRNGLAQDGSGHRP